jgi:hypothetical protein
MAAGFNCEGANAAVERRICGNPTLSGLDSQMSREFALARSRSGKKLDALLVDQRNWLVERNAAVLSSEGQGDGIYRARIIFLSHVFRAPERTSPVLSAIATYVATDPAVVKGSEEPPENWVSLGGDGRLFSLAASTEVGPRGEISGAPFDLSSVKRLADDPELPNETSWLVLLRREKLGGRLVDQGTAHDESWTLFSWKSGALEGVSTPEVLSDNSDLVFGGLVDYQGQAYAIQYDNGRPYYSLLTAQLYRDGSWRDASRIELRYDAQLLSPSSYCVLSPCDALIKRTGDILTHYDRTRDDDVLAAELTADEQKQFDAMTVLAGKAKDLGVVPRFGGRDGYSGVAIFDGFGGNWDRYFPIRWNGEILLGRIGNATLGWRESEDWLLAVWRWDGKAFVPLLGMEAHKQRERFLLSAWLPLETAGPE